MPIIDRVKKILLTPKTEWTVVNTESETPQTLLVKYVLPMSLIPAVAMFIGFGIIGYSAFLVRVSSIEWGVAMAVNSFLTSVIGYFICTYIIDALAPSFASEKNIGKSAQLVAYSYTASWVAGIFYIIPSLSILAVCGLYGIYLFYEGIPVMKKTPEQNRIGYILVSALVIIVVSIVLGYIFRRIIFGVIGDPLGLNTILN